jgi:hypothetical protein
MEIGKGKLEKRDSRRGDRSDKGAPFEAQGKVVLRGRDRAGYGLCWALLNLDPHR